MVIISKMCNVNASSSSNPICIGGTVSLSTDAASNISWSTGSSASVIAVTPSVTTTYSVTGTATNNCSTTAIITITVLPLPNITTASSPSVLCVGKPGTVTAYGGSTYTWSAGGNGQTMTVSPNVTTTYSVTGASSAGCKKSQTVVVNVNTNSLTVTPATSVCKGSSANLTAGGAETYTWSTGLMFASIPVTPSVTTVYTVGGTDIHGCDLNNSVVVTVNDLPQITASSSASAVCKGEAVTLSASGASTYVWNTGATASSVTYTLLVDVPYNYTVTGTDNNGCSSTAFLTVNVSKCTGVEEIAAEAGTLIYPNPARDAVNIVSVKDVKLRIVNELGQTVKEIVLDAGNSHQVTVEGLAPGVYYITGDSGGKKLIIE
jgi:hypothetical protein